MSQPKKVLIVARYHSVLEELLAPMGYEFIFKESLSYGEALKEIADYEGLVTSNHLPVDRTLIDAAKQLRWIGRLGSGMEIIDSAYAATKNIACFSSPEGNANAMAEQCLGMLLALQHRLYKNATEVKQHLWEREANRGYEIEGKTVGIIGLGHNGSALAKKLVALGLNVLAFDTAQNNYDLSGVQGCADLTNIYQEAEIISFHVPLNSQTKYYFNRDFLDQMRHRFILLNLSRGPIVEQAALYAGLKSCKIVGAALDVWEREPFWKHPDPTFIAQAEELLAMPHFIGTSHIAGYTHEALYKMSRIIGERVKAFLLE